MKFTFTYRNNNISIYLNDNENPYLEYRAATVQAGLENGKFDFINFIYLKQNCMIHIAC